MTKKEAYVQVNEVFRDVFDDDNLTVNDDTTANDIEDWDSLEHVNLIVALEDQFNMRFTMEETNSMKNVGEMVDIILSRV